MSKLVYIDIDVIPNGATIQTEVRKQIKRFLWAPVVKDNCNRILGKPYSRQHRHSTGRTRRNRRGFVRLRPRRPYPRSN